MKKIITAALAISMIAAMSTPAFAILTENGEPVIQGDIMLLNGAETPVDTGEVVIGEGNAETPIVILPGQTAAAPKYTKVDAKIVKVVTDDKKVIYAANEDEIEASVAETVILDIEGNAKEFSDIEEDQEVYIFVDSETGNPAYIVIKDEKIEANVAVDGFKVSETLGEYVDTQNFLAITVSEDTAIVDLDGNKLTADDIANKYLMVFYDKMTMSIPAITNPLKVIVLGDYEPVEAPTVGIIKVPTAEPTEDLVAESVYDYEFVVDGADAITDENGVIIVPVRKYAEKIGLEVNWNGEDMSVTVGTIPMGVSFRIGENSYSKARMTPFTLEVAPQLINDTTYVPVSFFEQVLNAGVKIAKA